MVVTKNLMDLLIECLECAVNHADAGTVPKGDTLEEMRKALLVVKVRTGGKG